MDPARPGTLIPLPAPLPRGGRDRWIEGTEDEMRRDKRTALGIAILHSLADARGRLPWLGYVYRAFQSHGLLMMEADDLIAQYGFTL